YRRVRPENSRSRSQGYERANFILRGVSCGDFACKQRGGSALGPADQRNVFADIRFTDGARRTQHIMYVTRRIHAREITVNGVGTKPGIVRRDDRISLCKPVLKIWNADIDDILAALHKFLNRIWRKRGSAAARHPGGAMQPGHDRMRRGAVRLLRRD